MKNTSKFFVLLLVATFLGCANTPDAQPILSSNEMGELKSLPSNVKFSELTPAQKTTAKSAIKKALEHISADDFISKGVNLSSNRSLALQKAKKDQEMIKVTLADDAEFEKYFGGLEPVVLVAASDWLARSIAAASNSNGELDKQRAEAIYKEVMSDFGISAEKDPALAMSFALCTVNLVKPYM